MRFLGVFIGFLGDDWFLAVLYYRSMGYWVLVGVLLNLFTNVEKAFA